MNYLVVDIASKNRAPYIAKWLNSRFHRDRMENAASCAGLYPARERDRLSVEMLSSADVVLAMDSFIEREIRSTYSDAPEIINIDVPDRFNPQRKDGVLPHDIELDELKEYMSTNEFGTRAMDLYLDTVVPPYLSASVRKAV